MSQQSGHAGRHEVRSRQRPERSWQASQEAHLELALTHLQKSLQVLKQLFRLQQHKVNMGMSERRLDKRSGCAQEQHMNGCKTLQQLPGIGLVRLPAAFCGLAGTLRPLTA